MISSLTKKEDAVAISVILRQPMVCAKDDTLKVPNSLSESTRVMMKEIAPCDGEINLVVDRSLVVRPRLRGWLGVCSNATVIVRELVIPLLLLYEAVKFYDIRVL